MLEPYQVAKGRWKILGGPLCEAAGPPADGSVMWVSHLGKWEIFARPDIRNPRMQEPHSKECAHQK